MEKSVLNELFKTIYSRKESSSDQSYTAKLFEKGENQILKKIGEEATELVMASVKNNADEIIYETADLFYHILVLLAHKNLDIEKVFVELKRRMGTSGLEEKANRGKK